MIREQAVFSLQKSLCFFFEHPIPILRQTYRFF